MARGPAGVGRYARLACPLRCGTHAPSDLLRQKRGLSSQYLFYLFNTVPNDTDLEKGNGAYRLPIDIPKFTECVYRRNLPISQPYCQRASSAPFSVTHQLCGVQKTRRPTSIFIHIYMIGHCFFRLTRPDLALRRGGLEPVPPIDVGETSAPTWDQVRLSMYGPCCSPLTSPAPSSGRCQQSASSACGAGSHRRATRRPVGPRCAH